jgi:hypothetical protein
MIDVSAIGRARFERRIALGPPIDVAMDSMKMMSWWRYHCLSKSLLRAERRIALRRCSRPAAQPRPASVATGTWRRLGSDPLFPICNPAVSNLTKLVLR